MRRAFVLAALPLLFSFSLSAQSDQFKISPALGPSSGGTTVTITGPFGSWPYDVVFGDLFTSATRIDDDTVVAVTPAHSAGIVDVRVFEYDVYISTTMTFEYVGHPEREQFLLPVFTEPVQGAHGSEFRTELHGLNMERYGPILGVLDVWGLETPCRFTPPVCNWLEEPMVFLEPTANAPDLSDYGIFQTGTPGRFIEIPRKHADHLSATLRVYDTSRSADNYGTEIPIVRTTDFLREPFSLIGVPTDPRFRNTLRLYGTGPTTVNLLVGNDLHQVQLRAGAHRFDPAYAQFTAFPTGTGPIRVFVNGEKDGPAVWGFITVTNNETQHITTITPR